jgi:hypothetical protein
MNQQSERGGNGKGATKAEDEQNHDVMGQMSDSMDAGKGRAAGALRDVAQLVRDRAGGAPVPGADRAAEAAAKPLETSAQYLEEHTPGDMWADLMDFCRDHPAGALFAGFGLGYMVKKLMP